MRAEQLGLCALVRFRPNARELDEPVVERGQLLEQAAGSRSTWSARQPRRTSAMVESRTRSALSSVTRASLCATSAFAPNFPGKGIVCEAMNETQLVSIVPTFHLLKLSFCTPTWSIGSGQACA